MPYPVPQFIREKPKLMGLIDFTQVTIIVILGAFLFLTYQLLSSVLWLWIILSLFVTPLALAIAFGKYKGIPIYQLIGYIFRHIWLPKQYLWKKERIFINSTLPHPTSFTKEEKPASFSEENISSRKVLDKKTLEQLANILNKR